MFPQFKIAEDWDDGFVFRGLCFDSMFKTNVSSASSISVGIVNFIFLQLNIFKITLLNIANKVKKGAQVTALFYCKKITTEFKLDYIKQ